MTGTPHPPVDEWARLLDGEVTANRAAQMEGHAAACSECEREIDKLTSLIRELERPMVGPDRADVAAIMRKLDDAPATSTSPRTAPRVWLYSGAAVASAAAILLVVSLAERPGSVRDPGTFTARGNSTTPGSNLSRSVGFSFVAGAGADRELSPGDTMSSDTPITATYRNTSERAAFALIFAIDAAGDVHWLYPAFTDPSRDPLAVRLSPGERSGVFGETVVLDAPAVGALRLVTITSREPLNVSSVETLSDRNDESLAREFPEALIDTLVVEVSP